MHHKRGRPKNRRAGCLICKPNKMNGWSELRLGAHGFGKLREAQGAAAELQETERG